MNRPSEWTLGLLLAFLVLSLAACDDAFAQARGSFDRTLKVTWPVNLEVQTGSGSITVRPGGADSVQVRATITARDSTGMRAEDKVKKLEANPPIEQDGNTIRIGYITDHDLQQNVSISYELTAPAQTQLRSRSGSGHQTVDGIKGPVDTQTGSGGVTISNVGGELRAQTGSGSIELDNIQGGVRAQTGSGSIRANRVAGAFDGGTGSGSVRLVQSGPGDVRVHTGSGSVEMQNVKGGVRASTGSGHIDADGEATAAWSLETGSGGITLRLPPDAKFDLFAHTGSGRISSDHQVTMQGSFDRHELRGKVNGGGVTIDLRTSSGNITIR
jgi:DUF4097 and DUF4098 domain-containing protein YvlB